MAAAGIAAGLAGMTGVADAQAPRGEDVWPKHAVPEEEAATAGRRVMPLTQEHIRLLGELVRQQQRATLEGAGFRPSGRIRRVAVDPGAGAEVPAVEVRHGFTTVLSWTDTTGSPWPIEEVLVDSQFLPGEGGEEGGAGHLVYLAPKRRFLSGNLVVKLRGLAEPLVVLLQDSGGAESDFRVEMRLARPGPGVDAAALMRPASFHADDGELAGLLAGAVPDGAVRVELSGGDAGDRAWRQGEDLLLRDSMLLARQVEHRDRLLEQERQRAQRAEQGRQHAEVRLARAIRHLHGLGQDADAIAAALAVDADEVRRVLSG